MKRRKFVFGCGIITSVGMGAIGTGAISQVTADRDTNLQIAQDSNAYLGITSETNSELVGTTSKGTLQIDLTEFNDLAVGDGFNKRASTELTDPTESGDPALFSVQNQSDRDVELAAVTVGDTGDLEDIRPVAPDEPIPEPSDDQIQIELFDVTDGSRTAIDQSDTRTLSPGGGGIGVGLRVIVPESATIGEQNIVVLLRATEV